VGAQFLNVRGTVDFNTQQARRFYEISQKARSILEGFGYEEIILPLLEEKGVFAKGVGQTSDIVERQMFKIEGKDIVLRPEGTAQVVRYYLQQALHRQSDFYKFFYIGPMFRGERPQKGRLRQFHHIGAEAIGSDNIYLDAEMIILALEILAAIGATDRTLFINTLGCAKDKGNFSVYLHKHLGAIQKDLCDDCRRRLSRSPLRVLDCKHKQCQEVVRVLNLDQPHICVDCKAAFEKLLSILDHLGVQYTVAAHLVRGLDYYTNTVFEITSKQLGSKDAIGAGGRYNNLVRSLGGPDVPAIGFALGLERILLVLKEKTESARISVFIAVTSRELQAAGFELMMNLRKAGIACDCDYTYKSLKGQLRLAQKKGVAYAVIVGDQEWARQQVLLRDMRAAQQQAVDCAQLASRLMSSCGEK